MVRSLARHQFFQNSNHVRLFQSMIVDNDSPIVYTKCKISKILEKISIFENFFQFFEIIFPKFRKKIKNLFVTHYNLITSG